MQCNLLKVVLCSHQMLVSKTRIKKTYKAAAKCSRDIQII